jgi:pilus assembly protein CpaB
MRPKSLVLLALALSCGLIASIGISQVMDRSANTSTVSAETVPIYVALHNINLGDPIDTSMVSLQEWPKDKIPPGAITQLHNLEGRRPRATIIQGEPILDAKLLAQGEVADPIAAIPKGYRLKTISVDAQKSAAGLLSPGDRVDIQMFVNRNVQNGINAAKTKIILQNIRVFAVDQTVQRSSDGTDARTIAKTISLLLTPEQVNKVELAEHLGEISLIPRNPNDEDTTTFAEHTAEDLLSDEDGGSRRKEQGRDENNANHSSSDSLLGAIQQAMPDPNATPPFRMEIVEADAVRELLFDGDSGKPLRDDEERPSQQNSAPNDTEIEYDSAEAGALIESAGGTNPDEFMDSEFPIDFAE